MKRLEPQQMLGLKVMGKKGLDAYELAIWYNDNVIYPDKVRLNCYYYRHYSFIKDIQMIQGSLCSSLRNARLNWKRKVMNMS